jgi:hypothetical protein
MLGVSGAYVVHDQFWIFTLQLWKNIRVYDNADNLNHY